MKKTRNIGLLVLMATSLGQLNATQTTGGLPFETTATVFHPTDTPASAHGLQFGAELADLFLRRVVFEYDDHT